MERITVRLPDRYIRRADTLAEVGEYPNRAEVFREGARVVFGQYDFTGDEPRRRARTADPQPQVLLPHGSHIESEAEASALSQVYNLRSGLNGTPFIVFDAGGLLTVNTLPDDVEVARDASELREAIREISD